tara:strand:- start:832 stop:1782 length:951 start_codon:yes stop_codon:yes gene_type:complete
MKIKYFETTFDEYVNKKNSLHPYIDEQLQLLENNTNIIFSGPKGIGKYTQALKYIKKYSDTELKYERKINIVNNKKEYIFKISDIHFEIDMEILGCNARILWNTIYYQIVDIISSRENKKGIILCKNFHHVHPELLDIFYSYMQTLYHKNIDIKYVFITEHVSFLPHNILNRCIVVPLKRPTKSLYNKCLKYKLTKKDNIKDIVNIKLFKTNNFEINSVFHNICDKIIKDITNYEELQFLLFRDHIYDMFIYQLNINECLWYIITHFINKQKINDDTLREILLSLYTFFKYFNNNYRPIYHVEKILFNICRQIHCF